MIFQIDEQKRIELTTLTSDGIECGDRLLNEFFLSWEPTVRISLPSLQTER